MGVMDYRIRAGASQPIDYTIDQSLRFEDGDTPYLSRTPSSAGNRKTWTWSGWIKHSTVGSDYWENVFGAKTDANNYAYIVFEADVLRFFNYVSGSQNGQTSTSEPKYRDPSAWRHVVIAWDTTQATAANRLKIYINGEQLSLPATVNYPSQNHDGIINSVTPHYIGGQINGEFDGYLAEMYFVDGQALTAASFGETDPVTNQWKPIEVTGMTYGTNGFYLPFSSTELANSFTDSSTLHSVHTVTANGNAHTDTSVKKFGTASLQLDGTGDYLSVSNNNDFNFGTGDFTIDCWVRSSDFVPGADAGVILHLQDSGSSDFRLAMGSAGRAVVGQDYGMSWGYNNGGSWSTTAYGSNLADGSWHHVACSRQGSYFYLFQDGVLVSTTSNWGNLNITGNATCQIGRRSTGQD